MSHNITTAKRLTNVKDTAITAQLADLHFKNIKNTYQRKTNDILGVVSFQRSKTQSAKEKSFTLNVGIFVPGVWVAYVPSR